MEDGTLDAPLPDSTTPTVQTYTLAQVATHGGEQSCWSAINGSVYDLTSWISQHPGGDRNILKICGRDGSSAFNGQHGDNTQAQTTLKEFYIGTLVQ
jgi:cytochrome b involved in lipid metabolism